MPEDTLPVLDCNQCPVVTIYRQKIATLEERMDQLTAMLDPDRPRGPHEWRLSQQEAVVCWALANGPKTARALRALLDHHLPSSEPRDASHVSTVLRRARTKLQEFGWGITYSARKGGPHAIAGGHAEAFRAAMNGQAEPYFHPDVKPKRQEATS